MLKQDENSFSRQLEDPENNNNSSDDDHSFQGDIFLATISDEVYIYIK